MLTHKFLPVLLFLTLLFSGCVSPLTGDSYSRDEARRPQTVSAGVITDIRTVTVEGEDSGLGRLGGAVIGGIIGSRVDGGHGAWAVLGGTVGALGGSVAGQQSEKWMTKKKAYEITIKEDNGRVRAIVQEPGSDDFRVGDRVEIVTSNRGASRVRHGR